MTDSGPKGPLSLVLRASVVLLSASIAFNLAVAFLEPVVPWLVGGLALAFLGWCVAAFVRWRRSRW